MNSKEFRNIMYILGKASVDLHNVAVNFYDSSEVLLHIANHLWSESQRIKEEYYAHLQKGETA